MKNTSPKCPLCGKFIKLNLDEPPDRKMDAHINSGCVLHVLDSTKDKRRNKSPGPKCGLSRCKNEERYELVRCKLCRVEYCLEHRHPSDHSCSRIDIEKKRKEVSARERTRLAQSRLLKEVTKPKGTEKIPKERRFYVEVEAKTKAKTVCFDSNWTIGKCIDVACERLGIENNNNDPKAPKVVFTGKRNNATFPFDIPINLLEPALVPGDTLKLGVAATSTRT
eukprot:CAMPEP_0114514664 /NCGR_PEP_ID=MMETSP0109-20121206/16282_1 /TAXON_ID=29199 /ORGANISM="Chlorarachnion reptans, Strain CCCM449" /LENGTH=222 /DNA_ID=CAMNT_0001694735 /DNA_START=182 /DNA_END=850 /DNA_ORIENTATION=+